VENGKTILVYLEDNVFCQTAAVIMNKARSMAVNNTHSCVMPHPFVSGA
jgi:hypothetical protein